MNFFNIDMHISVIADLKHIFENLGHRVDTWSLSRHTWVFSQKPKSIYKLSQRSWVKINRKRCDQFYNRYREELSRYDAFIATYPPAFSMLYERFNKPIIVVAATRYEYPFSKSKEKWADLNTYLREGIDNQKIFAFSNNKYDAAYAEYFTHRQWKVIPSLGAYTKAQYNPKHSYLLYSSMKGVPQLREFTNRMQLKKHKWQDIVDHKGIIHVPYNIASMAITEQYTANCPLFFPSLSFTRELMKGKEKQHVLNQLSFNSLIGLPPQSQLFDTPQFNDPNNYLSLETMMNWIPLADFYDEDNMPHISYFDSFDHMKELLRDSPVLEISKKMQQHNIERSRRIYASWESVLHSVEKSRYYKSLKPSKSDLIKFNPAFP